MDLYDNIPAELRKLNQWVCWKLVYLETDAMLSKRKTTKVPYDPKTGNKASVINSADWSNFHEAVLHAKTDDYDGIGFVLTKDDPYTIIDLDKPLPGQEKVHRMIVNSFESYTELSQSGEGVHVVVKGVVPKGVRRDNVEIYSDSRYMVFTGNVIRNLPINERQSHLDSIFDEMAGAAPSTPWEDEEEYASDQEIVDMASAAVNAAKFNALCSGDWQSDYPSQSEADFALLSILAFYTKNNTQVKRIFRMSVLGKRKKAQREPYLDAALEKIRSEDTSARLSEIVIPKSPLEMNVRKTAETEPTLSMSKGVTFPEGLVGEIAQYIFDSAHRPVKEIALVGAIGLVAGICGRSYNISNTGLNQYLVLLAGTGRGKDGITNGFDNLIRAVAPQLPAVDDFMGPATFASGQALIRLLDRQPCFVSILGEFGLTMQELCNPLASSATVMLRKAILEMYGKSGANNVLRPSVYSDSQKNTGVVRAPSVTIIGESVPESFYKRLDISQIESGFLPRFSIVEYAGKRPPLNKNAGFAPGQALTDKFADLVNASMSAARNNTYCPVQVDDQAQVLLDKFNLFVDDRINDDESDNIVQQLWNRAHLKVLRLSALIAVGKNIHQPVVSVDDVDWAIEFVTRDVNTLLDKFAKGGLGFGTERQEEDVRAAIVDYLKFTKPQKTTYKVPKLVKDTSLIPYSYLRRRLKSKPSFAESKVSWPASLTNILKDMVAADILVEVNKYDVRNKYKCTTALYFIGESW